MPGDAPGQPPSSRMRAALLACERAVVLLGLLLLNIASDPDNVKMSERLQSLFSKRASLM